MSRGRSKPVTRVAGNLILSCRTVRFFIPGKVKPGASLEDPGTMILTQHWLEVEHKSGARDKPLLYRRYKVKGQWWWTNPMRTRHNPHLPKRLSDDDLIDDLSRMCCKGDRDRARDLLNDLLNSRKDRPTHPPERIN